MGKQMSDVSLRLWAPKGATILFVKQVAPTIEDLTDRRMAISELVGNYPTGTWGEESRSAGSLHSSGAVRSRVAALNGVRRRPPV